MDLGEISQLCYQLKLANQELTSAFEKETGFSLTRYELLQFLKVKGHCSQRTLQTELKIDSAAVTRHLKVLEEKNYVCRERNPNNHREVFVSLTKEASSAMTSCEKEHAHSPKNIMFSLDEKERQTLLQLLTKLVK